MTTEVIIIGAGPTGLMFANQLKRFGINFLLIDTKGETTLESRAMSVSSRSMELYQQLGLSDKIIEQSLVINAFGFYNNGKKITDFSLTEVGKPYSDFGRLTTTFEQNKNEKLLYENLQEKKANVLWNTSFVTLEENEEGIVALLKNELTKENISISAKYIVGCDGARSSIRHQRDFTFEGGTYQTKFFVADVIATWKLGYEKIVMAPSKGLFVAFFPLQGEKRLRIVGTLPAEYFDQEEIDFDVLEKVIRETTNFEINFDSVGWHSIYKVHHRCVDEFNKGRIYLAGDAAHVHSPAGGQGMNTGLQDAHNLAWKMAFVLKGTGKKKLLETYNEERLPFAQSLIKYTDKGFVLLSSGNWFIGNFRTYIFLPILGKLMHFDRVKLILFKMLSQLFYGYKKSCLSKSSTKQALKFTAGDRLPYIERGFFNKFREPVFHLISISKTKKTEEEIKEIKNSFPFEIKIMESEISGQWKKFGVSDQLYILVRPDQYISLLSDTINKEEIAEHFNNYF